MLDDDVVVVDGDDNDVMSNKLSEGRPVQRRVDFIFTEHNISFLAMLFKWH